MLTCMFIKDPIETL